MLGFFMSPWRFLYHKASDDYILATEEVITKSVGLGRAPPTIRVNVFDPPVVLIGFNQDVYEEVNVDVAKELGFRINRRPTGGGAILMYEDTPGWEIWLPESMVKGMDVSTMYEYLMKVPLKAFHKLGLTNARYRPKNDIEVNGRKVSGTGIYMEYGGVMFCGTALLDFDVVTMLKVLKLPIEKLSDKVVKSFEERVTTFKRELGFKPSIDELVRAFKEAVKEVFNVELVDGELNEWELSELEKTVVKYRSSEWVYDFRRGSGYANICTYKTSAGLIRIHVKVFEEVLESVVITGDFFTYPNKLINDIEARLKWTHIDYITKELSSVNGVIHGLSLEELGEYIIKCCKESSSSTK